MDEKITEKIYCYDHPSTYQHGNNDALLAAAMCNKQHTDPMTMMAAMNGGGMGNQWNNPFIYLVWMMFAQRFFGNGWGADGLNGQNTQNIEVQNQLQAIRSQMQDNQNSNLVMDAVKGNATAIGQLASNLNCDFNALQGAICDVRGGIDRLSGQVGFSSERVINAVNMGDCNVIQALKDCCCTTQKSILEMGYQNQLGNCQQTNTIMGGINTVNNSVERGFSSVAYETQRQTCDIINAGNANTQRIIDTMNNHWNTELSQRNQDLKFEISQLKQNQYLAGIINNGGACNCGCGGFNQ